MGAASARIRPLTQSCNKLERVLRVVQLQSGQVFRLFITMKETWFEHNTLESSWQSKQWVYGRINTLEGKMSMSLNKVLDTIIL